jgi:hypothetical protein
MKLPVIRKRPIVYREVTTEVRNLENWIIGTAIGLYAEDEKVEFKRLQLIRPPPYGVVKLVVRRNGAANKEFLVDLTEYKDAEDVNGVYFIQGIPFKRVPFITF